MKFKDFVLKEEEREEETIECPECGKDIPQDSDECPECGADLESEEDKD